MAETRILGQDLEISAVGLGCMGFTHAYGLPADKDESIKAIREAVEYGYTFFDTAECYVEKNAVGILERNEDLVGEALKPYRSRIKLASKFGVTITDKGLVTDSRPETIRKAIDGSLKRLQTDHLDLYYQHRIDAETPAEEVAGVMADLIKEGKILHWGISETNEEYLRFVLIHMTGMHQSKREYIRAIMDGTLNYYSEETDSIDVSVSGDTAVMTGHSKVAAAVFGGGRHTWRLALKFNAKKMDDGWKLTKAQASTW